MTRSIDQRIVEMRFDNAQFERGVKDTTSLLDRLKDALKLGGGKKGIEDVQRAADGFSLDNIASGVDHISDKFSALGAIGFSILQDLTRRAIDLGANLLRTAFEPVLSGGRSRAMNLEQANFQFEGLGMDVEKSMDAALYAVQDTAFGLDEAAVLAANFGATGMEAGDEMADALRGVSGVAAMAGASYSDVGNIFGKVAGQGRLMGDDLNRLAARGVNAAATMAEQMGITETEFRDMVSQGEISFQMFAEGMNEAFGDHATKANETYTGSLSNMRAALSRVGASFFTPHLTRQRDLFNALTPLIDRLNDAIGPLIEGFSDFLDLRYERIIDFLNMLDDDSTGGRILETAASAIESVVTTLMTFARPVAAAFNDIFGGATIDGVVALIDGFRSFAESFALSESQAASLQSTFAGIFAIFDIGFYIFGQVAQMIGRVAQHLFSGADGFLGFTGGVGDSIVAFRDMIKEGDGVSAILGVIETVLKNVIDFLRDGASAVSDFFGGFDFSGWNLDWVSDSAGRVADSLTPLATIGALAAAAWGKFLDVLGWVWDLVAPLGPKIAEWASGLGQAIADALRTTDWNLVLDFVNTTIFAGFFLLVRDFFKGLGSEVSGGLGIRDNIKKIFDGLTGSLTDFQNNLKADTLMKLAIAIGLLAVSVVALSMVDPVALTKALTAVAVMFGQLMGSMAIFSNIAMGPGMVKLPILATSLILLAGALALLTVPVLLLSMLDWDSLLKGLAGLGGILALIIPSAAILSGLSGSFIRIGIAMIPFATGVAILAGAVTIMSKLSWDEIGRGLTTLAGSLVAISVAMALMPSSAVLRKGVALGILAAGINLLVPPLERMSKFTWEEIGKGLTTLAGALIAMAVGLKAMSGTIGGSIALTISATALNILMDPLERMGQMGWENIAKTLTTLAGSLVVLAGGLYLMSGTIAGSASLVVAAAALNVLIGPMERMGDMDWEAIAKSLVTLAGSLVILAGGLYLMSGTLAGAAALVVVSGALSLLVPVLTALGNMSWGEILTGLGALAGVFAVIGVAGALLTPVVPTLVLFGAAVGLIGAGMLAGGLGMTAFGVGITAVGVALAANGALILGFIKDLILFIPELAVALATGIADFLVTFFERSGEVVQAFGGLISDILAEIRRLIPEFVTTVGDIIVAMLEEIRRLSPEFRDTFVVVMLDAIQAFNDVRGPAIDAIVALIFALLYAIEDNLDEFIRVGVAIVEALISGIMSHVFGMNPAAIALMTTFISSIGGRLHDVLVAGRTIVTSLIDGVREFVTVYIPRAAATLVNTFVSSIIGADNVRALTMAGNTMASVLTNGIRPGNPAYPSSFESTGHTIGTDIARGTASGIGSNSWRVSGAARSMAGAAISAARRILESSSPSKVFFRIGKDIDDGLAIGIENGVGTVVRSAEQLAEAPTKAVDDLLRNLSLDFEDMLDGDPVIKPVLDLSELERQSDRIESILGGKDLGSNAYDRAALIANDRREAQRRQYAQESTQAADTSSAAPKFEFKQYNQSPKALSEIEIYRQTRNQLSMARGLMSNNA